MKIAELRIMRGPNYWSVKHPKIVVLKLDMEEFAGLLTTQIPGFADRLEQMFPGMLVHRSTEGQEGGYLKRVREEGVSLSNVVEHVALELQTLGGMESGFGRSYPAPQPDFDYVVFSYQEEKAGEYAAHAAIRATTALAQNQAYDIAPDVAELHEIREDEHIGPSTYSIVSEAVARGIPYIRLNKSSLIQLGYGVHQKRIQATMTCRTAAFAVEIAGDKNNTKEMLHEAGVPVPEGETVYTLDELKEAIDYLGYPIVTKPLDGNHGKGAGINLKTWEEAAAGFEMAQKYSEAVIVEQFIEGYDFRLLVVNKKFIAAAKRTPAMVIGDGTSTVQQLVDKVNSDPRRGVGHEKVLTRIAIDKDSTGILEKKGYTLDTVLAAGEELFLKSTANLSTGGTATDVTDLIDPYNVLMAERIAGTIGLDICGIDVVTSDIAIPLPEARGAVIEVNAAPGFRMHVAPTEGLPRNVAEPVVEMLFPDNCPSRIPIIAVTGTNGKTTTTRLIAHMVKSCGYQVGFTTTDGIYIQDKLLEKGDTTGSKSAEFVLRDPTVNFAVLECARGGMLRAGLGFRQCDIGIVTNVAEDHMGLRDIYTLEDMARVKAVVPKSVSKDGYAILNADDDNVYQMAKEVECKVAFFSMDENNPRILKHVAKGGLAAVFENGFISIFKNTYKIRVDRVADIPLTFGGRAKFNIENVLAATLAGYISRFEISEIKTALRTFVPSASKTPGRMNLYKFPTFEVLVDYAHNPAGMKGIADFLQNVDARKRVGIVAGVGDRRDEDFVELGRMAAQMFDEIIIRSDKDLRGRSADEIYQKIIEGIELEDPRKPYKVIGQEMVAIAYALEHAERNSFITIFSEDIPEAIKMIENFKVIQDRRVMVD
ncbi:cyanophycin synthetase [Rufibacter glacialis]|uniref:Cyanophycin synthetase n=1 Tax=Rufibacter glacialis TaxID=1259555 RepID=A0A5M8QHY8_9BACT|nr:cyanophycin synthetase [Rufibacter glacialis]KAA6434560.1 cyanophycin synthetase [Rufibacter glacialis]GGK70672.1 cyanophycin synthetase [Rufibacter glacialis]